jgi:hypothetical protein
MTRWTSLKASRPYKPSSWGMVGSHRRLNAPTLATFPWRAQEPGTESSSQHDPRVPQPRRPPASWPRQKQHPPLRPQASALQTHGEVVSWSTSGGGWQSEDRRPLQSLGSRGGDFALDK